MGNAEISNNKKKKRRRQLRKNKHQWITNIKQNHHLIGSNSNNIPLLFLSHENVTAPLSGGLL